MALLGNPNAGKSSLFNALTGLQQKTGNYSGVTVDRYEGSCSFIEDDREYKLHILDLPGLYSLYAKTADEQVACSTLLDPEEQIDVVVIVADAGNIRRNLLLATQLIDLKFKTVLALNMIDEAEKRQIRFDIAGLSAALGVDVVPVDSRHRQGFTELKRAIVRARVSENGFYDLKHPLLSKQSYRACIQNWTKSLDDDTYVKFEESDKLYRFKLISYLLSKYVKSPAELLAKSRSGKLDRVFTHKVFGYLVLLALLLIVFQLVFYVSEAPMNWIESLFLSLGAALQDYLPPGKLSELVVNGLIPGVSGVLMFIPQIAFLFLIIGLLEDSGYMARAGFIMDRVMRPFGLNGKSVIPLISGTACAVPSIMATRAISNSKERLITIFILPLISCSARLPVYTLLIAILYPDYTVIGVFNSRGLALFVLYMLGFVASLLTAFVLSKVVKNRQRSTFIMELPVYRLPVLRNIALLVVNKVKVFINEAGKIILAISVVLWFLSAHAFSGTFDQLKTEESRLLSQSHPSADSLQAVKTQLLEHSYIGQLGHVIEPVIRPLGFDWKIGIALLTSFAAREVFVGTMATIYQSGGGQDTEGIREKLRHERRGDGSPKYNAAVCWSLLLFYAFALQCMSTVAVVKRETKSWLWVIVQFVFMSALAYGSSWLAFQILS